MAAGNNLFYGSVFYGIFPMRNIFLFNGRFING
jgi:hypothetical protein